MLDSFHMTALRHFFALAVLLLALTFVGCYSEKEVRKTDERTDVANVKKDSVSVNERTVEVKTIMPADMQNYSLTGVKDTNDVIKAMSVNNGDTIKVFVNKENNVMIRIRRANREIIRKPSGITSRPGSWP